LVQFWFRTGNMRSLGLLILLCFGLQTSNAQPVFVSVEAVSDEVKQFGLYEMEVRLNSTVSNPYDFDQIWLKAVFTSPLSEVYVQDGFYYQPFETEFSQLARSGEPFWKLRFTPAETGLWSVYLIVTDSDGSDQSETLTFTCVPSSLPSLPAFVNDQFFLSDKNGSTVFLVGENIAWAEFQSGTDRMHEYMEALASSGANFAKLMMVPWSYSIEWGPQGFKNYSGRQDRAFMLDSVFRMADRLGLYLQLAFSIHDELRIGFDGEDWRSNPYNQTNGGPCAQPKDFFSNSSAMTGFKNRMRYINARWGYSQRLFGWELFSEADNFPDYNQFASQVASWAGLMAGAMKQYDVFERPVSVGFALTKSNPAAWNHPDIGFTQFHYYGGRTDLEGEAFRLTGVYRDTYQKPVLGGEYGIDYIMDSIIAFDPNGWAIHNGLWASALSGSFGAVVPWFWDAYIHDLDLYYRFNGISNFMKDEQLSGSGFQPVHLKSETKARLDFVIEPKFDELNQKAPSSIFTLRPTGILTPSPDSMGTLLFGPSSVFANLRNPPVFYGNWPETSMIELYIGPQVNSGVLQISLNGQVILEQSVTANQLVQVLVPAGNHSIGIDNIGSGFLSIIELDHIVFTSYIPIIRGFALMNDSRALAWVHNRLNNWQWYRLENQAPVPEQGIVVFPYYSGAYEVDFYSTTSGMMENSLVINATESGLVVPVEDLSTDLALKVALMTSYADTYKEEIPQIKVYPNPSTGNVTFAFESLAGAPVFLSISDMQGRTIYQTMAKPAQTGLIQLRWEPMSHHRGQMFLYRIVNTSNQYAGKLILE